MEGRCWRTNLHVIRVCKASERPLQNLPLQDKVQEQIAPYVPLGVVILGIAVQEEMLTSESS